MASSYMVFNNCVKLVESYSPQEKTGSVIGVKEASDGNIAGTKVVYRY